MRYRRLGKTGVQVSTLCLGAMSFGKVGNQDAAECERIVHRALEAGVNVIDTADVYSSGESEEIVGRALRGRRDDVVLATKFFNPMGRDRNRRGASRRWIAKACEESLRRLGTDYIDLYQVHRPDENTDVDETLGALSDLVRDGKVRMIGSSTFPAHDIVSAQWTSEARGHVRLRCEQPPYSVFVREVERDVLPTCERFGMGAIVWSPLNGGWLTGKYRRGQEAGSESRFSRLQRGPWSLTAPAAEQKLDLVPQLEAVAAEAGIDLITLALGFTLAHPAVTATIIGPRTMEQLESQLLSGDAELGHDVLDRIDALVPPGTTLTRADVSYEPQSLRHTQLRRRPAGS